jgi:Tfp pilus assembly protein FimT
MPIAGTVMIKLFRVGAQKAYFCGGATGSDISSVISDKIIFATATTTAQASANLSDARFGVAGLSDKEDGFACGGYKNGTGGRNIIDKTTYSTDTTAALGITLNLFKYLSGGINAITKGYVSGGATSIVTPPYKQGQANTEALTYSTETIAAATTANLGAGRWGVQSINGGTTKGYFAGGTTTEDVGGEFATADKITFSNDTRSAQASANLSQGRFGPSGISEGSTKGYFVGGATGAWSQQRTVDIVTFSTDTTAVNTSASLYNERTYSIAVSEGLSCGYTQAQANWNDTLLLVFSTDVNSVSTSARLSTDRYGGASLSQSAI